METAERRDRTCSCCRGAGPRAPCRVHEAGFLALRESGDNRDTDGFERFSLELAAGRDGGGRGLAPRRAPPRGRASRRDGSGRTCSRAASTRGRRGPRVLEDYDVRRLAVGRARPGHVGRRRAAAFSLTLGGRVDRFSADGRDRGPAARVARRWATSPEGSRLLAAAFGGLRAVPALRPARAGESGNPDLVAERSRHLVLAAEQPPAGEPAPAGRGLPPVGRPGASSARELEWRLVGGRVVRPEPRRGAPATRCRGSSHAASSSTLARRRRRGPLSGFLVLRLGPREREAPGAACGSTPTSSSATP
jgi:hypothetical protein